ncbi:MAG TPA: peptidylprolyl isomerase [Candidatus Limnocylindrales bacterium]|nr:peptidylprolyl isomerase [Candidatus Limnocylindrales bacterium]
MAHAPHPSRLLAMLLTAFTVAAVGCSSPEKGDEAKPAEPASNNPVVVMTTNKGVIEIELFQDKAPLSVKNFLEYAEAGHYDGTIFHRVIKDFMIQGGGFTPDGMQKPNRPPVKNEANNGLKNERGTVAMARTSVVDSATSQFFINHANNAFLDHKAPTPQGFGYAVFGKVTKGMDVVDAIANTPTADKGGAFQNRPTEDIVIQSVKRK